MRGWTSGFALVSALLWLGTAWGAKAPSDEPPPLRSTQVLDQMEPAKDSAPPLGHRDLFQQEPAGPLVWPPPPPIDPSRAALGALDTATNEFEAPPMLVTRITALPAASGLSPTQIVERFERNLLRERVVLADRLYRHGEVTNAMALLTDLDKYLRNPRNRGLTLNRLAAYEFRRQNYPGAIEYMRQAIEVQPQDVVSKINLAAVLMTIGQNDEALGVLLEVYPSALGRPALSFSVHFNLACVYSMKKDTEKALQNLAIAAQTDPASTLASLGDPQLDQVRTDTRFVELSQALQDFLSRTPRR